ncbi:MAG: phosphoglycerate kinase [Candidatus Poribacteria bacterium]|nr:phosphoglycerate kinase [Candidatus Poribacteria bacterium]MDE0505399.1 phosphoglycerate kinase [Candidatus Poribacteria bacterium]
MAEKLGLNDITARGKRVLVRVDFNVPMKDGRITDNTRIRAALPTILQLIHDGAKMVLATHLGRPNGFESEFSTEPLAVELSKLIGQRVQHTGDCIGPKVENTINELQEGDILLLENIRFYKEETQNDAEFARTLAVLVDMYVNDAFGTAHRAHASTEGITRHFDQCAAGLLMEREIEYLGKVVERPEHPFVAILGGAKISDKIGVIENLIESVDALLIGGGMAYTFLKTIGLPIGDSIVEPAKLELASELLKKAADRNLGIFLPEDHVIGRELNLCTESRIVARTEIPDGWRGLDIGPKSVEAFGAIVDGANTIFWNGPLGMYEFEKFANGTIEIAKRVAESDAVSIIGGGDCVAAVHKAGVADRITHISTGGGASLEFLEGKSLPGIDALTDK